MKAIFSRIHPLLASVIVVAALFVLLIAAYGLTRWASQDEVMGRVAVSGTPLGGLTRDQALSELVGVEDRHRNRTVTFTIEGALVTLQPAEAGFDADEEAVADAAMSVGRQGNAAHQFLFWLRNIFSTQELPLAGGADEEALREVFQRWEREVIAQPASLGSVEMEDGVLVAVYPKPGLGIDRGPAADIVERELLAETPETAALPTAEIVPRLTDADVDAALAEANQLIGAPIEMLFDGDSITFSPTQLAEAFRSRTIAEASPQIVNFFDPVVIDTYLQPVRERFEAEPVDAEFVIEGDDIFIKPGLKGTRIDEEETATRLYQAGLTTDRIGQLPLVEDADPEITTEYLESLQVNHLVSSFTTYHSCCENRVRNIQTFADAIDLAIVLPGEQLSLNQFVGQRTEEKGYLPAGTIVAGQLVDTIGGGVSQFATTFYNAVFWGGYQDDEHSAHSYYFSRYPEGIEATINWRTPDLVFTNNRESAILIDTQYTSTSITVRFFGDNDGRVVKGEQRSGRTIIDVVAEGGPDAWHVEGAVSGRYARTDPPEPTYVPNPELEIDEMNELQSERQGWSVTVTRRILIGGRDLIEELQWVVRYAPTFAVIEVHPCMMPDSEEPCPTTTTVPSTTSS
ncbi:MAG: VanW family protein [Acidimicrobiia bacterium]|nr:VanW family protein [Acidimicrobiia bacterium]